MYGTEKPLSKRGRLIIVVLVWMVGIPLFIGLFLVMSWVAVILFVGAVWATWDYLKKGDFFGPIDRSFRAESRIESVQSVLEFLDLRQPNRRRKRVVRPYGIGFS